MSLVNRKSAGTGSAIRFVAGVCGLAMLMLADTAGAAIAVGYSSLIDVLDYTDTFTITSQGGATGRPGSGAFPVNSPGINVENNHGNAAKSWTNTLWSITQDAVVNDPGAVFTPSAAGSSTGMTQTGGGVDYGIEYGLATNFVVQFDAFQPSDRIDITAGATRNNITSGLSVFFRTTGHGFGEIGLYNGVSEINSGLTSGIASINTWHNYAVRFDTVADTIEVFVDEVSRGTINLATYNGGTHNTANNAAVNVGGTPTTGTRFWSDNFQVGTIGPAEVGTMVSLSTDVLREHVPGAATLIDGYNNNATHSTVELVRFIGTSNATPMNIAYNQNGDTIDVSPWVVAGAERGAGQGLKVNGYRTDGAVPGAADNLYLRGEPNVDNEGFGAHANWIVTFDLDDIRDRMLGGSDQMLSLTGEFGAWGGIGSADATAGVIQGVIFLDGVRIDSMAETIANPAAVNQAFSLLIASGRWLTFGIFNGDGSLDSTLWDDGLFQNVALTVVPAPASLPAGVAMLVAFSLRRRAMRR